METARLKLCPFELGDATRVRELAGDYEIARTTLHVPHPYPDDAAEAWIQSLHAAADEGRAYGFAVTRKTDGELLGVVSLGLVKEHQRAELSYWMGRPYWGHGYTSEAARRLLDFGFNDLHLNRIFAFAFTDNPASTRVMEKIGMQYEGTLRQHVCKWGEYKDLAAYGCLKSAFASNEE